ncbi:hypothetical protein OG883_10770 [Streptomyces sp. NBC_01142]|uniref:hypothetical protein n=1 Tax=Streptomyces sp. NBC_01142 TaxID=2975865 RepID=UPI002250449F|nr:hypothetical protein [Streptomyces sp. NBC_01142]MCX4820383.1 hypothetical protein [Streptomyces sp. NBC_01142]
MNQPARVEAVRAPARAVGCRAVCRVAPLVLLVLLGLLAASLGSGSAAAGETRVPASAPVEPAGESPPEETDTALTASGRPGRAGRPSLERAVAPSARPRPGRRTARPASYRPRTRRPAQPPLRLRAARCVVLRC